MARRFDVADGPTLSSGDVRALTGLPQPTLSRWVDASLACPALNAGKGHHRRFTVVEATALAYGARLREEGFGAQWIEDAMAFVANLSEAELEEAFDEGRTLPFPLPPHLGQSRLLVPVLTANASREVRQAMEGLDLQGAYQMVLRFVERQAALNGR